MEVRPARKLVSLGLGERAVEIREIRNENSFSLPTGGACLLLWAKKRRRLAAASFVRSQLSHFSRLRRES